MPKCSCCGLNITRVCETVYDANRCLNKPKPKKEKYGRIQQSTKINRPGSR